MPETVTNTVINGIKSNNHLLTLSNSKHGKFISWSKIIDFRLLAIDNLEIIVLMHRRKQNTLATTFQVIDSVILRVNCDLKIDQFFNAPLRV